MCFESWAPGSSSPWPLFSLHSPGCLALPSCWKLPRFVAGTLFLEVSPAHSDKDAPAVSGISPLSLFYYYFFSFCFHDFTTPSNISRCFLLVLGAVKSWKHKGKDKRGSIRICEKFTASPSGHTSPQRWGIGRQLDFCGCFVFS